MGNIPTPKHPGARQRRNKVATFSVLKTPEPDDIEIPKLPLLGDGFVWHPLTIRWWVDVWKSPMSPEFTESDTHGLYALAMLVNEFWTTKRVDQRTRIAAEIRLQGVRFGLSPIDRRRLQWQIEETEEKQRKGKARRVQPTPEGGQGPRATDPRAVLRDVSDGTP